MEPDFIKEAVAHGGTPVIKHIKTGGIYYIKDLLEAKVNGKWEESVLYYGVTGRYVRLIGDFQGFEYIVNETGLKG